MAEFRLVAPFKATGNQPECIERLAEACYCRPW